MAEQQKHTVRDPAKPGGYYEDCMALLEKYIQSFLEKGPVLYSSVAEYYVRMARAAYSAGEPIEKCERYLCSSSEYLLGHFKERARGKPSGLAQIEQYLEWFAASELVGQADEVIGAFRNVKLSGVELWEQALMDKLCAVLTGEPVVQQKAEIDAIKRIKPYADLPALFQALNERDVRACGEALDSFLTKSWGPSADRAAKADLKKPYAIYTGKWSLFSAAVCDRIGVVPKFSKKAMQYLPVELVST